MRLCSKLSNNINRFVDPDASSIYSGYFTGKPQPGCGWLEAVKNQVVIPAQSGQIFDESNSAISLNFSSTEGIYPGVIGAVTIDSIPYPFYIDQVNEVNVTAVLMEYDNGWTDSSNIVISDGYIGGLTSLALGLVDDSKFNSSSGYGSGSRQNIMMLPGIYSKNSDLDLSFGGTSLIGLLADGSYAVTDPVRNSCNGPHLYLGDPADIETVVYDYYIKAGSLSRIDGINIYVNVANTAANDNNIIMWPSECSGSYLSGRIIQYGDETLLFGLGGRGVEVGNVILEGPLDQYICQTGHEGTLNFSGIVRANNTGSSLVGCFVSATDNPTLVPDLIITGGNAGLLLQGGAGTADNEIILGNVIIGSRIEGYIYGAIHISTAQVSQYQIGTAVISDCTSDTLLSNEIGITDEVGLIHIGKLAIAEGVVVPKAITYDKIVRFRPDQRLFFDPDNGDYTIVHPLLIKEGIGVYKGSTVRQTVNNLRSRL